MTSTARNPLTDEVLDVRSVINKTVDSVRLSILRAANELPNPTTNTDLAKHADVSRQTASLHLAALHKRGVVNRHDDGVELTAGGLLFLDAIEDCLQTVPVEALSFFTRSAHPLTLLQSFAKQSYRLNELMSTSCDLPSQSTIRRVLTDFVQYQWLTDDGGTYRVTPAGNDVLSAYGELAIVVEQLIEKAPWFQRLPMEVVPFPVEELADAEFVVSNPRSPASVLSTCLKLYDRNISQFRCLCSVYNPVLFHAYHGMLKLGVEAEAILDWPTALKAAGNPGTRYAIQSEQYNNYQPFVLKKSHTLGIGIYDNRRVAVAAYNEVGSGKHIAMIVSSNDKLVSWGIDLYESYRAEAFPATDVDLNGL